MAKKGKKDKQGKKGKKGKKPKAVPDHARDRHLLYEAAVQSPEADLEFFDQVFRSVHGRGFTRFREDFCGTAALSTTYVKQSGTHRALCVDLDRPTLDWGTEHYLSTLTPAQRERIELRCADVRDVESPRSELTCALNFSYGVFKTRDELRKYFESARRGLEPGGVFVVDAFGGTEAMDEMEEDRDVDAGTSVAGLEMPAFTYVWEQARFNIVDHHMACFIHFELDDGTRLDRAFHYEWRVWTLPELLELMREAGFADAGAYLEGWDEEEDDGDGLFERRDELDNQEGWVGYVVGFNGK